jgi:hypothetical protein
MTTFRLHTSSTAIFVLGSVRPSHYQQHVVREEMGMHPYSVHIAKMNYLSGKFPSLTVVLEVQRVSR